VGFWGTLIACNRRGPARLPRPEGPNTGGNRIFRQDREFRGGGGKGWGGEGDATEISPACLQMTNHRRGGNDFLQNARRGRRAQSGGRTSQNDGAGSPENLSDLQTSSKTCFSRSRGEDKPSKLRAWGSRGANSSKGDQGKKKGSSGLPAAPRCNAFTPSMAWYQLSSEMSEGCGGAPRLPTPSIKNILKTITEG